MFKKIIIFAIVAVALASCAGRRTSTVEPNGDTVEVHLGEPQTVATDTIPEPQ